MLNLASMLKNSLIAFVLLFLMANSVWGQDTKLNEDLGLKYLVQLPAEKSERPPVIILLHGRGSNERDLFSLRTKLPKNYLIISARAPYDLGSGTFQWFEMTMVNGKREGNVEHLANSRKLLTKFIDVVVSKYSADPKHVYMMGFSQGAMMSYEVGLTTPDKLKGIGVLSGSIFESLMPLVKVTPALKQLKIFIGHGTADPLIGFDLANLSNTYLKSIGLSPEFHSYTNMTHQINAEELDDLMKWLAK